MYRARLLKGELQYEIMPNFVKWVINISFKTAFRTQVIGHLNY